MNADHRQTRQPSLNSRRAGSGVADPTLNEVDVAWLSGLLEGEGYFGLVPNKSKGKTYRYARVGVSMTDRDVVERAAGLMGARVVRLKPATPTRLTPFRVNLQGQRAVALMRLLRPHLGERRRQQIDRILAYEAARPDPNAARREWSSTAARNRARDERGRLTAA